MLRDHVSERHYLHGIVQIDHKIVYETGCIVNFWRSESESERLRRSTQITGVIRRGGFALIIEIVQF